MINFDLHISCFTVLKIISICFCSNKPSISLMFVVPNKSTQPSLYLGKHSTSTCICLVDLEILKT